MNPPTNPSRADRSTVRVLCLALAVLAAPTTEAQRARTSPARELPYELVVIEPFETGTTAFSSASSVNDIGQVTGYLTTPEQRAFLWTSTGGAIDLGDGPSAFVSAGRDVNLFGMVAGSSDTATLWTGPDDLVAIPPPPGTYAPFAFGLNDVGRVVGEASISSNIKTAWVWDALLGTRNLRDLGVPGAFTAAAINESNVIVGQRLISNYQAYRFDLDTRVLTDLGTLGGPTSEALGLSDLGHVVGWARNANYNIRPFLWTPAGGMQDLGSLGGHPYDPGRAYSVDSAGRVVGTSSTGGPGYSHAFLWDATHGMRDLNKLVEGRGTFELIIASRISNTGWIVGDGRNAVPGALPRAYVLRPR